MDNLNPQRITKPLPHDPFGMLLVGRNWEGGSEYRYGFNTQEQDDEVYGNGNLNSAIFWEYDTRLGRRWNVDPKVNLSISSFACFSNSPISVSDIYGDTTYRFNTSGIYLGVDGLEVNGLWGTIGIFKTTEKGNQYWLGDRYFKFNDPKIDIFQLESMKVGDKEITLISDKEINSIMKQTDIHWRWLASRINFAATESGRDERGSGKMDYGLKLGGKPGGGKNEGNGNFILYESSNTSYNAMDAGQFLWGQAMKRLGFDYSSALAGSQINEKLGDSEADQRAIKSGYFKKVDTTSEKYFKL